MSQRPLPVATALSRIHRLMADPSNKTQGYELGSGGYVPRAGIPPTADVDLPWTTAPNGALGADCAALPCFAYGLYRHRPGFNKGGWATVTDDLNGNSMQEDGDHSHELFRRVYVPEPGDVLAYSTFKTAGLTFIGHVAVVLGTDRAGSWQPEHPAYHLLDIAQICGPNGRRPCCIKTDGSVFDRHNATWPTHPVSLLRLVP